MARDNRPILALTQGDPAGIGPQSVLRVALAAGNEPWLPLLVAERAALEAAREPGGVAESDWRRLHFIAEEPDARRLRSFEPGAVPVVDPVARPRRIDLGRSRAADAAGALAALDRGIALARSGVAGALVTAPVSKESIARHVLPGFAGHTDYLAQACGLEGYGRDYLMAFLSRDLRVALLSTHLPLAEALARVSERAVGDALDCLARNVSGRIAVAALNPHAGEGGLFGDEDERILRPAVAAARARGIDVCGPESADSLFARARQGEFDWVLALYHDQGLIAVKTVAFGSATNWTMGLPFVRTSVDHGTAFGLAAGGSVDVEPLRRAVATALELLAL